MTDTAEQQASMPWLAWAPRKTWEEVRVRLRSRDGNEWEELASDFQYWIQSADGQMCDDVVAFQIVGETPLDLASVSSASADTGCYQAKFSELITRNPEPVPATNQAGEVEHRFWLIVHKPGNVPERKGSWPISDVTKVLREFIAARPDSYLHVVTVDRDGVPEVEHGPEVLQMADGRSMGVGRKHNARTLAAHTAALATQPATSQEGEGKIDWSASLEALHEDGRVVEARPMLPHPDFGKFYRGIHIPGAGNPVWFDDKGFSEKREWTIRNTAPPAATPTPPTLSEDTLDWSRPVEAIHTSGQVEPVRVVQQGRGEPHAFALIEFCKQYWGCTAGGEVTAFGWRIRNVARAQVKTS